MGRGLWCRWALEWHTKNRLDGESRHFLWTGIGPLLFWTRAEARKYAQDEYGYIKESPDLRGEPYGWHFPRPVKVQVILRAVRRA